MTVIAAFGSLLARFAGRLLPLGGSASKQAGTRVDAGQASKRAMREPTLLREGEGWYPFGKQATGAQRGSRRGSGIGIFARGKTRQHGKHVRFSDQRLREHYGLRHFGPTTRDQPWTKA